MAVCSFSRIVVSLSVLVMAYWAYNMYKMTVTTSCKKGYNCLKPLYPLKKRMQLSVYVSPKKDGSRVVHNIPIFSEATFRRNESLLREINITLPSFTINNGSLFAHIFIGPQDLSPEIPKNYGRFKVISVPLTKYLVPSAVEFNLVTGEYESAISNSSADPVSHWVPMLDILGIGEDFHFDTTAIPYELIYTGTLKLVEGTMSYFPIISCKNMKVLNRDLLRIYSDNTTMPLTVSYSPVGLGQFRVWMQFSESMKTMNTLGFPEKELDAVKELLFVLWRCFSSTVVCLYLMEENTSLLVLVPAGIGTVIEYWKLKKALKVKVTVRGGIPRVEFGPQLSSERETDNYDSQAMRYLSYVLVPLVLVGSVYCLLYLSYKSWYSWLIHTLVNGVYAFGFLFMLPQLFVNYKLKSVAHLPWKAFMYKAFNTFIDDVFAFIITMPTSHRVAVFRDDLVFLVYLYQRWLYPVDRTRVNEFGESFETDKEKKEQ